MFNSAKHLVWPAVAVVLGGLGLGVSGAAFAESESAESSGAMIEEIIVTARKREESAQEVPIAITALSGELRSSTIRNLADVNGFAPNVNIGMNPGRTGGSSIIIRGISPTRVDDNSLDSPIGVMIDGIHLGTQSGQIIENFDIERIEILRGPQGTLFGKNTVGGVVNVVRSRPTGELGARVKYTMGKWGQRELRAVFNTPVMEDKLAAKVFYTTIEGDGYMYNTNLQEDFPRKDYSNYGIALLANPNDRFEALLTVEKYDDNSDIGSPTNGYNVPPGVVPPPTDPRSPDFSVGFVGCIAGFTECRTDLSIQDENTMDFNGPAAFDVEAYTLNMSLDITDQLQVVSVTGYREMVEDRLVDLDGAKGNYITIERDNDFEQISQELRFEFVNDRISAIAGAYYWRSEFDQDWVTGGTFWYTLFGGVVSNPALLGLCWAGAFAPIACDTGAPADDPGWQGPELVQLLYEDQITKSIALFTQVDYEIMPRLTATAGLRWTKEKKRFIGAQSYLAPVSRAYVHNHPGFADLSQTWKEISPKFSLSYQHSDDILFYASYSEGFHSGGYFGVNQNTRDFVRDQYDPEFANSWEGGMKGQFLDNRVQLNATYFYNDFKDKQEQAVVLDQDTKTVATVFSNVASAVYQGFEVDLQLVVNQYISLFATFGYLDAEYKDFMTDLNPNDDNLGQKIEDATHLRPRNAPKNTYGFGGTAVYPVGEGEIEVHAKYHFIDKIETSLVNADNARLASRDFIDASVGYNWRSMRLTLFGRNLDDEVWETYGPIANLFAVGTRVPGRSWGIELEVEL